MVVQAVLTTLNRDRGCLGRTCRHHRSARLTHRHGHSARREPACCPGRADRGFLKQPGRLPPTPARAQGQTALPAGHFPTETSGSHTSPSAPPFPAGAEKGPRRKPSQRRHRRPLSTGLGSVWTELSGFGVWRGDQKGAPRHREAANTAVGPLTTLVILESLREHERPSCLLAFRCFCTSESTREP